MRLQTRSSCARYARDRGCWTGRKSPSLRELQRPHADALRAPRPSRLFVPLAGLLASRIIADTRLPAAMGRQWHRARLTADSCGGSCGFNRVTPDMPHSLFTLKHEGPLEHGPDRPGGAGKSMCGGDSSILRKQQGFIGHCATQNMEHIDCSDSKAIKNQLISMHTPSHA